MKPIGLTLLDPVQYRRTPWKNGGGVTIDIALANRAGAAPGDWAGMLWRFGRTRIGQHGPFSDLSGYERLLAVIEGDGLLLHVHGGDTLDVRRPFTPVRFDGAWPIESELTHGPVGVLNLMADRTRFSIDMTFLEPGKATTARAGNVLVLGLSAARLSIGDRTVDLPAEWSCSMQPAAAVDIACREGRIAVASIAPRN
jgi:environmental stress-induced protein Ves